MPSNTQPNSAVDTILRPGQVVDGKYRIDRLVGRGGMAAVWAGTNERTGKSVALKVILKSFATTPEAEQLFRREALAASKVNHPNVVTVFDVISHEGMACIVMELLDGEPLSNYLARKGFLSAEEAVALLLPAMRGVAAANGQGVVHRDLKPQNIFICIGPDGRHVTTKVLDFGISVKVERVFDSASSSVPGLMMGTPAYMSPEHVEGARNIDERADVYGFGILLYEALTGQLPFMGEPGPELLYRILNENPPSLMALRPDLPPTLVRIVEAAMAKKPDHRFSDVNSMVRALEEEFLSPAPLPRSLTPFAGVALLPIREGGVANLDSAVYAPHHQEGSGAHNETRVLFSMPSGDREAIANGARPPTDSEVTVVASPDFPGPETAPVWLRKLIALGQRRGLILAAAGVMLLVTVWITFAVWFPSSESTAAADPAFLPKEDPKLGANARRAMVEKRIEPVVHPAITITPTSPAAPPASETRSAANDSPAATPDEPNRRQRRGREADLASARRAEEGASGRGRDGTRSRSSSASKGSTPRAGTLSPSDF